MAKREEAGPMEAGSALVATTSVTICPPVQAPAVEASSGMVVIYEDWPAKWEYKEEIVKLTLKIIFIIILIIFK